MAITKTQSEIDEIAADAIFKIGRVVGVQGRTVRILVDKSKNGSHLLFRGKTLKNVSVGGYVKIAKGFSEIIGKVDGESVAEDRYATSEYSSKRDRVERSLNISLVGFFKSDGKFERGVQELPLLDNECFILSHEEFERVHSFVGDKDKPITIGSLPMERGQEIKIGVDALFASHIGIFGNTGSGKSYTLASLYHRLLSHYEKLPGFTKNARLMLIDFNGEYVNAPKSTPTDESGSVITATKQTYSLSTKNDSGQKLPFPRDALEEPEFWQVLLDATEKTQAPFLQRTLRSDFWESKLANSDEMKKEIGHILHTAIRSGASAQDRASIFRFLGEIKTALGDASPDEFNDYVTKIRSNLDYHSKNSTFMYTDSTGTTYADKNDQFFHSLTVGEISAMSLDFKLENDVNRIHFKIILQYYSDTFRGFANPEHLGPLIKRLENRIPAINRVLKISDDELMPVPLTVVSLRDVSLEMKKVLPLLLCAHLYKKQKDEENTDRYLNLIIDEAHTILSRSSSRESETWKDYRLETFEEIIKEGRKFGVFLTIASQRPHDISETIISQLHNYFLHRLINNLDIHAVERSVSYLDRVSFESLPILPTGTCVLSGIAAQVPVMVSIDPMDERFEPNSKTKRLSSRWESPVSGLTE